MRAMTEGYLFERRVLDECERRGMSRIVRVLAAGTIVDEAFMHSVDYLVFEPADGDIRRALDAMGDFDTAWALTVCHQRSSRGAAATRGGAVARQAGRPRTFIPEGRRRAP
jgi:hypothetical protein